MLSWTRRTSLASFSRAGGATNRTPHVAQRPTVVRRGLGRPGVRRRGIGERDQARGATPSRRASGTPRLGTRNPDRIVSRPSRILDGRPLSRTVPAGFTGDRGEVYANLTHTAREVDDESRRHGGDPRAARGA